MILFGLAVTACLIWSAIAIVLMMALAKAASKEVPVPQEEMKREA